MFLDALFRVAIQLESSRNEFQDGHLETQDDHFDVQYGHLENQDIDIDVQMAFATLTWLSCIAR